MLLETIMSRLSQLCPDNHLLDNFYVIAVISNPIRYESRAKLYKEFAERTEAAGVQLYTVEVAFGDRTYDVTSSDNPRHIQLRTIDELWHKENMINIGVSRLPQSWEYVAWIDADVEFVRPDWALETAQQLQHYEVVQMWDTALDLGPNYETFQQHKGFAACHYRGVATKTQWDKYYTYAHPGLAWAATKRFWNATGGLIDRAILGSADHHMAWCMVGRGAETFPGKVTPAYHEMVMNWQKRVLALHKDVGYVPGTLLHHWHGKKRDRFYVDRWQIILKNNFDPQKHLHRDWQGLWQIEDHLVNLRDDVRRYFRSRNEDSIDLD